MEEPGKYLELAVPRRLQPLAAQAPVDVPDAAALSRSRRRGFDADSDERRLQPVGPTARSRLLRLAREEDRRRRSGYFVPRELGLNDPIPGLVVSLRYRRQDMHGVTVRTRDLDIAFRRAAATLEGWRSGDTSGGWSYPMRPERGGLWVLDARRGSFELYATVYGSLVAVATSNPVALAGLVSLAFDAKAGVSRAGTWVGHIWPVSTAPTLPSLGVDAEGDTWSVENTKALQPVMLAAIESGAGFEFVNRSASAEIRIAVPPRKSLESGDD